MDRLVVVAVAAACADAYLLRRCRGSCFNSSTSTRVATGDNELPVFKNESEEEIEATNNTQMIAQLLRHLLPPRHVVVATSAGV